MHILCTISPNKDKTVCYIEKCKPTHLTQSASVKFPFNV